MCDVPFSIYFDFETTSGKNCTLYPISYAFAVPIHPKLNIEKIYIVRSFNHTFDQLNDVSYLPDEMLPYFDTLTPLLPAN